PMQRVAALDNPREAVAYLRREEERRLEEIRGIVIASVNNVPVRVEDVVEGGPVRSPSENLIKQGVVVSHQTRLGKVSLSRPKKSGQGHIVLNGDGSVAWEDEEEKVQGIVLMRKNEETMPALRGVKEKIRELNDNAGRLLPGVHITPTFDLTGLINVTT